MAVSGNGNGTEPAVALVSPAGSSAPPQPATEPDTSTANNKPRILDNGKYSMIRVSPVTRVVNNALFF